MMIRISKAIPDWKTTGSLWVSYTVMAMMMIVVLATGPPVCLAEKKEEDISGRLNRSWSERQWIESHPVVRMAAIGDFPHYQFGDDQGTCPEIAVNIPAMASSALHNKWNNHASGYIVSWNYIWGVALLITCVSGFILLISAHGKRKLSLEIEERKKVEAQLRKLSRAVEQSPASVVITDTMGQIEYVNPMFTEVTGYTPEEVIGKNPRILKASCHSPEFYTTLWETILSGKVWTGNILNKAKDGHTFWERCAIAPIVDESNTVTHFVAVKEDITSTKTQEERFQALLEAAPDAMVIFDEAGAITLVNSQTERLFGYQRNALLSHDIDMLVPGTVQVRQTILNEYTFTHNRPGFFRTQRELEAKTATGDPIPVEISVSPVKECKGVVFLASIRNITERKRAEKELNDQLMFQAALIDMLPNPVFIKNPEGRYAGCNRAYEEAFGTTRQYIQGRLITELTSLPEKEREKFQVETEQLLAEGGSRHHTLQLKLADGKPHDLMYWITRFQLSDGRTGGLVGLFVDITEMQRLAKQLEDAKIQAEKANRAKSDFLARMSHEIRTPMNAIIGLGHLILQTDLTRGQKEYVNKLQAAAMNLLTIINDILDFSKIEANKMELEQTHFNLSKIMDNLWNIITLKAEEKGIELLLDMAPDVPDRLCGDPLRLGQVLTNMANNAVKFTHRGRVTIGVHKEGETKSGIDLRFFVKDTGIGMTREQMGHLFISFRQADGSITRKYGGTGLGLTISKSLVELMGGTIHVASQPGKGSTFSFTLHFKKTVEEALRPAVSDNGVPEALERIRGSRILVTDDNDLNREIIIELLEHDGFSVDVARNGMEALEAVKKKRYDIVLMDIEMPVLDGLSAARMIRSQKHPAGKTLPIIAMTAHAMAEDRQKCLDAGMNDHTGKPIDFDHLRKTIIKWIQPGEAVEPLVAPSPSAHTEAVQNQFPGISITSGLSRLMGKKELYLRLLNRFQIQAAQLPRELDQALKDKDYTLATRLVHTLKSNTATLGAAPLAKRAMLMEKAITETDAPLSIDLLSELKREHALVLDSITRILADPPDILLEKENAKGEAHTEIRPEQEPKELPLTLIKELLDDTGGLIKKDIPEAMKRMMTLQEMLKGSLQEESCTKLLQAMEEFETDEAMGWLEKIARSLNIKE